MHLNTLNFYQFFGRPLRPLGLVFYPLVITISCSRHSLLFHTFQFVLVDTDWVDTNFQQILVAMFSQAKIIGSVTDIKMAGKRTRWKMCLTECLVRKSSKKQTSQVAAMVKVQVLLRVLKLIICFSTGVTIKIF